MATCGQGHPSWEGPQWGLCTLLEARGEAEVHLLSACCWVWSLQSDDGHVRAFQSELEVTPSFLWQAAEEFPLCQRHFANPRAMLEVSVALWTG